MAGRYVRFIKRLRVMEERERDRRRLLRKCEKIYVPKTLEEREILLQSEDMGLVERFGAGWKTTGKGRRLYESHERARGTLR